MTASPAVVTAPATPADAAVIARLHRQVREACLPWLPRLHTPEQDLVFFRDQVLPASHVLLARSDRLLGFVASRPGWIDHLYVDLQSQGQGIGTRLLELACAGAAEVRLWTFQRNDQARAFYAARGFREEDRTDGHRNEEGEPDILLVRRNG